MRGGLGWTCHLYEKKVWCEISSVGTGRVAEPEKLNTVPVLTFFLNTAPVPAPVPGRKKKLLKPHFMSIFSKIKLMGTYWVSKDAEFHIEPKYKHFPL